MTIYIVCVGAYYLLAENPSSACYDFSKACERKTKRWSDKISCQIIFFCTMKGEGVDYYED